MVAAAGDDPVTPGSRVKVALLAGEAPLFGTLVYLDAERLSVQTPGAPPIIVDRPQVKRLYVSQGLRRNTKKGLLAGAGAWLLFTGVIAAVDTLDESGVAEPLVIAGFVGVGGAVGSLVRTEHWRPIPLPRPSAGSPSPSSHHSGIRASFSVQW